MSLSSCNLPNHSGATADAGSRGDKNLLSQDIPKPDRPRSPDQIGERRAYPLVPPNVDSQQAGQVANQSNSTRAKQNVQATTSNDEQNGGELKYGTEPGQVSNVPGETANGVHGTSNGFGAGGKPIFIPEH
jgi:hypothetical protein